MNWQAVAIFMLVTGLIGVLVSVLLSLRDDWFNPDWFIRCLVWALAGCILGMCTA